MAPRRRPTRTKGASFTQDVRNFVKKSENTINDTYKIAAEKYASEVIRKTPVDQGFAKGSWSIGINGDPKIFRERADKVGNFTVTRAIQAIAKVKPGDFIRLATNIPYMTRLEYGWSKQQPNGWIRQATARFRRMVRQAVREARAKNR